MRFLVLTVAVLSLAGFAGAQHRQGTYDSLGGYGNVLYPGTGHAPATPPGGINGANFGGRSGTGRPVGTPLPANHQQHRKTVIVPYPVYYGGYVDPSAYQDPQQLPPVINGNGAPSVVINPGYVPTAVNPRIREYDDSDAQESTMRMYQNRSTPYADMQSNGWRNRNGADEKTTIYLIAFKDHSIVQALGYWMEGSTLHYVSSEHTLNQASLDLIDRDLSQRLNDERSVEFKIPASR